MNTCPKCGSPQASELTTSGFTLQKKAMWFGCGSHVLLDEPEKILSRTNQCCDQEEINDLRRKVEELQVALDFANEAVDQRERSRKEAETKLREVQATKRETLYAVNEASTIHSCGDSCSRPMCVLRRERDAYKEALEMIAYDGSFPKLDCQKLADATLTEIEVSKEGEGAVHLGVWVHGGPK
jgi:hypothetical protein